MAVLRIQENIKKADGTYDAVYKETEAGLVLFDDNETLQQKYDAGELNGQDIYAEAVAKGYTGTEDEFFTMLASGPWVSRSGDPGLSGGSLKFWDGVYGISIEEVDGQPTLILINDNDGAIAGSPLIIANVESPSAPLDAANKKYVDDAVESAGGSDVIQGTSVVIGPDASVYSPSYSSIVIGNGAKDASTGIAIGYHVEAHGSNVIALGSYALAGYQDSIAIGSNAAGCYSGTIAVGANSHCSGSYSIAIGGGAKATKASTIALGVGASSVDDRSISIGENASSSNTYSIAIGPSTNANQNSIAIGYEAKAESTGAVALGCYAKAYGANSVALGQTATISSSDYNTIQLGCDYLSALRCHVSLSVTSDIRDKTDITPISNGAVELLEKITPISYFRNPRTAYIDSENLSETDAENRRKFGLCEYDREAHLAGTKKGARRRVGVSAQAVQEALSEVYGSASYANIVNDNLYDVDPAEIPSGVESQLTVNYEGFVPFLIKAVQELSARIKLLEENKN